ncbi:uncharacterized protein LOC125481974, partial [Rhincodon typus]|uniref:uncharacterized protein LOC125481974 n=1 Tax=Rhincodon typus TaxID=259920 RepID=UPI00202E901F
DEREPDKLRFDLDAFRFYGDERSLIFITCHLKVAAVDQGDSRNKACTFQKLHNVWTPLEESNSDICACCHVGNCGSTREILFLSRGRRDLLPEDESEAGLKLEGEASLGPLLILDPELTNLTTEPLTEVEQTIQERSPGVDQGDSRNKACTFQTLHNVWTPLEESNSDICACCHVGNCGSTKEILFPSRGRRDLGPEESEAGLKWEGEASLGPLLILDPELTSLATEPLTEVEQTMQERSPGGVQSELVVMVALTVTAVSLISASLMALFLYRKHKQTQLLLE